MEVKEEIGHYEILEVTNPVLITWNDGEDNIWSLWRFQSTEHLKKAYRYPIPRIPHASDKLAKAKFITNMDFMKGFHQNEFKTNSIKFFKNICNIGTYEETRMPFGIKYEQAYFQTMMDNIFG
ncbi:hypothetical protein O181_030311 [Austropuccinia psidii MF-1]|uniref:Uncharacterized protein n=1 Tax=Austropuccinia psidii MF-1 TaxID=1389203 RepID=A0A9Q3CY90_9BASI|nr:hypothetical protein [Austropuccinia psidii MF-1]